MSEPVAQEAEPSTVAVDVPRIAIAGATGFVGRELVDLLSVWDQIGVSVLDRMRELSPARRTQ